MSHLFWLSEAQLRRIQPLWPRTAYCAWMIGVSSAGLSLSSATACAGAVRRGGWATQDPVQPLRALEPPWGVRPRLRRACRPRRQAGLRGDQKNHAPKGASHGGKQIRA